MGGAPGRAPRRWSRVGDRSRRAGKRGPTQNTVVQERQGSGFQAVGTAFAKSPCDKYGPWGSARCWMHLGGGEPVGQDAVGLGEQAGPIAWGGRGWGRTVGQWGAQGGCGAGWRIRSESERDWVFPNPMSSPTTAWTRPPGPCAAEPAEASRLASAPAPASLPQGSLWLPGSKPLPPPPHVHRGPGPST